MAIGVDDKVRDYIEDIKADSNQNRDRLCVLLETDGGYIEVVERIYRVFRQHYKEVVFVVPNFAYSAGTVLVLSGDEIWMDYYSVLGPIDPQMEIGDLTVPGIGYLHKFSELVKQIKNADPSGTATRAELTYLVQRFDPAILFYIEQARDHAITLIEEWLPKHKFKNWHQTQTSKTPVGDTERKARAKEIAEALGEPKNWHSHGRGIGIAELAKNEIKLLIENFGADKAKNEAIRTYYHLVTDYFVKIGMEHAIHGGLGIRRTA
jgi:Serine dehydrogenase proteinase